ncbi:hypothetical protein GJU40_05655 [Bacillus lacus]|uniref:Cell-wall binding lipoprotein n=1 Tax=Metabacillus lacus TaxID=1983721 RepID=A0A7X2LZF9_9BACI|nr:YkyA family protein [Metabacillus lacus]MRX71659.1 hypothetical protein [Metabacillus lacus]
MKKRTYSSLVSMLLAMIILAGCSGTSPAENIYNTLEKVVSLEDTFKEQQEPLYELERQENELYNQIISLGMKEYDEIVSLSQEAAGLVEEREERITQENESIQEGRQEFEKINDEIEKMEDGDAKNKAIELRDVMTERYQSYDQLHQNYTQAISQDKQLYTLLQNEDLKLDELEGQISQINESYEKVIEENKRFNEFTDQYNQTKKEFYEAAGLEVNEA